MKPRYDNVKIYIKSLNDLIKEPVNLILFGSAALGYYVSLVNGDFEKELRDTDDIDLLTTNNDLRIIAEKTNQQINTIYENKINLLSVILKEEVLFELYSGMNNKYGLNIDEDNIKFIEKIGQINLYVIDANNLYKLKLIASKEKSKHKSDLKLLNKIMPYLY